MIRQCKEFNDARSRLAGGFTLTAAELRRRQQPFRLVSSESKLAKPFPPRPDATVISDAIPVHYIARNKNALWLAREASGSTGGLFFLKRSAVGFAHRKSERSCATMLLSESFELDLPNEGGRLAALFNSAMDAAARRAPAIAALVRAAIATCRRLLAKCAQIKASARSHREAIERELFDGQYVLASKNDDDLPIPPRARRLSTVSNSGEFR